MIFPPFLGQESGDQIWPAILGFLITGVGLPLLGVMAIAKTGDLQTLANRVHPIFSIGFTFILYLAIGPLFGIPRTGTVAYEMSVTPFLPETLNESPLPLFFYSIVFFGVTAWLSLNPSKLVDRIGRYLTPALLIIIAILVIKSFITPMGEPLSPKESYMNSPFFKGFIDGYLTLDALAALVFGIVVIGSIRDKGISDKKTIMNACMIAGGIAAAGLALVYISLAYIGATSVSALGSKGNGAVILSEAATYLYGPTGLSFLGLAITLACLTTSIGLVSSCAKYFSELFPNLSYQSLVFALSIFSLIIANFGLTQLIQVSLPVLMMIYPIAIVLILLSYFHNFFHGFSLVYIFALIPTGFISLLDGLKTAGIQVHLILDYAEKLPFYNLGIGWSFPALFGAIIGFTVAYLTGLKKTVINN